MERHPGPPPKPKAPYYSGDIDGYMSPLGNGYIDGRTARREDMAAGGCREVDPSERPAWAPKTEAQVAAERKHLEQRRTSPYAIDDATIDRAIKGE